VIAIGDNALNGVEQAVDVDDGPRVSEFRLEFSEATLPILVYQNRRVHSEAAAGNKAKN
jgi:hypothetical protein